MPMTRKRKNVTGNDKESQVSSSQDSVDMENVSSNRIPDMTKSMKSVVKVQKLAKKESSKGRMPKKDSTVVRANVIEDECEVAMEVDGNITSDGELDSENESEVESDGETTMNITQQGSDIDHNSEGEIAGSDKYETESEDESESDTDEETRRRRERHMRKKARCDRRSSMEDKLDTLSVAVGNIQQMMVDKGFLNSNHNKEEAKKKGCKVNQTKDRSKGKDITNGKKNSTHNEYPNSGLITTVYHNAVRKVSENETVDVGDPEVTFNFKKQDSSSSEDKIDTSNELIEMDVHDQFISDCQAAARKTKDDRMGGVDRSQIKDSKQIFHGAEASKARLFATPGNYNAMNWNNQGDVIQSVTFDDNYLVIGAHIDASLQHKIINHEYIDFAKLLPKGRITKEEDNRLEIVSWGGSMYFVPVSDRETGFINNFARWEQVFRVFSNIYTRVYPGRSSELIQYNHIIFTASGTYVWENVYQYDKEFRMHMSHFPQCKGSIILQQAWAMYLNDRICTEGTGCNFYNGGSSSSGNFKGKSKEICRRYNKGKCTNGASCKYQHKCEECGKFGHGAHICRKHKQSSDNPPQVPMQESSK